MPVRALAAGVLLLLALLAGCGSHSSHGSTPGRSGGYLALGDSVAFGYREPTSVQRVDYARPATFVGYPQLVGAALRLPVVNAACPGETTASLISKTARSNGCENRPNSRFGYRSVFPLHVAYQGSQLQFATSYLRDHQDTRLVSLMIGANDGFLCQTTTKDHCVSQAPRLLRRIGTNVTRILTAVRGTGYRGRLVVVDYYSTDYTDTTADRAITGINTAVNNAAKPFGAVIADGYAAFRTAAASHHGNSCTAGLLTRLTSGHCGIHPSATGQRLLARAVETVLT